MIFIDLQTYEQEQSCEKLVLDNGIGIERGVN